MKKFLTENKNMLLLGVFFIVSCTLVFNYERLFVQFIDVLLLFSPLWYAIGIAFVLNIPMNSIENLLKKAIKEENFLYKFIRTISLLLTFLLTIIILYLLLIIVVPKVASSLQTIIMNFSTLLNNVVISINDLLDKAGLEYNLHDIEIIDVYLDMSWDEVFQKIVPLLNAVADGFISNALSFTSAFFRFFFSFCLSIYLLIGKEKYIYQTKKMIASLFSKEHTIWLVDFGKEVNMIFTKFIGGQLVAGAFCGVMFYIVFSLIGFPFPELLAVIISVCALVPVFGPMFGMCLNFVLIFAFDVQGAFIFIVIFQLLSNFEDNVIYPKIVGSSIGLNGLWILLSIFILGGLYGLIGMLLAVPLAAIGYSLFSRFVNSRLKKKGIDDVNCIFEERQDDEEN